MFAPQFDAAHRAALESGKSLVYVCAPAAWTVRPLLACLVDAEREGLQTLVLAPDAASVIPLLSEVLSVPGLAPACAVSGLARATKALKAGGVRTLVATPADTMHLLRRSSLPLSAIRRVVVCWPELHAQAGHGSLLDEILGECGEAQRLVVTASEAAAGDFVARHARRAPVLVASRPPETPLKSFRYAIVPDPGVVAAARAALDAHNPATALIWDPSAQSPHRWWEYAESTTVRVSADPGTGPVALAIATELPSSDALAAIRAAAEDVVVFARPSQLTYLRTLAERLTLVRLRPEVDRAQDWRLALRGRVRDRIEGQAVQGNLLALAPLFDDFDPALVAAALMDLPEQQEGGDASTSEVPHWVHLHLSAGKRDQLRAGDVVGALLNAAGLTREHIGRVDLRDTYTVVEVRAEAGESARRAMDGITLRGRTVTARFDRR